MSPQILSLIVFAENIHLNLNRPTKIAVCAPGFSCNLRSIMTLCWNYQNQRLKGRSHYTTITHDNWQKNYVGVHTTTKMIKLSFDDNDFKIAQRSDFFSVGRSITINFWPVSARIYKLSYRYRCVVWPGLKVLMSQKNFFDFWVADKKLVNRFFNIFRFSLFIHEIWGSKQRFS
jgi:hypothetical protein